MIRRASPADPLRLGVLVSGGGTNLQALLDAFQASPGPARVVVPDLLMRMLPDGSWIIELNPETMPRVLVNQGFYARVSGRARLVSTSVGRSVSGCSDPTISWLYGRNSDTGSDFHITA